MSVINQVLNELEQRGAHGASGQPMVRAVNIPQRNYTLLVLVLILVVLVMGVVAWQWISSRKSAAVAENSVPSNSQPVSSIEPEKQARQKQAMPTATNPDAGGSGSPAGTLVPAARLSFELSALPLVHSDADNSGKFSTVNDRKSVQGSPSVSERSPSDPEITKVSEPAPVATVPMKRVSAAQQADAEFHRAAGLMQQGRIAEAIAGYEAALKLDAGHGAARQALVALLLEGRRNAEAEKVLLDGLSHKPDQVELTMLLARLQVERGELEQASATLEKSLPFAGTQSDYRAFLAAILQRQNRHEEAVKNYQIVVQNAPGNGVWLMGYGISLQALQRTAEAKDAFQRALDTKTLNPELKAFVQQRLKGL